MSPKGYETKESLALQLFEAVEEQNIQDIFRLLDHNRADPNIVIPEKGVSPFHLVIGSDCAYFAEEATRAFLQRNGNPNVRSEDGLTPVHVAAVWGRTGLLVLLLSCGGDPSLRDNEEGRTPLHLALKEKHWEAALILQRYQLMDRRHRHSGVHPTQRFNMNLETIVVNAGEMQAEYAASPQNNMYPILSPVPGPKKGNNGCGWNIEPLETQEYVRQWCHKEFTPVTSTPTHHKPLNCSDLVYNQETLLNGSPVCKTPNITSSKVMTPKNVDFGANNLAPANAQPSKSAPKPSTDVRKNLFLELKKRFNGLKQSFDSAKDDSGKANNFERKGSFGYFRRKSAAKLKSSNPQVTVPALARNDSKSCISENLSFVTSRSVDSPSGENATDQNADCEIKSSLENSPVDEVDAVPLNGSQDTSVEWIASQSCFSEELSPNSSHSQSYFTCDEGPTLARSEILPIVALGDLRMEAVPIIPEPPVPPVLPLSKQNEIPQRPPRRKQLKAMNTTNPESAPSSVPSTTSFGTIVSEEYRYTDDDAGVVLIESHLLVKPVDVPSPSDTESVVSVPHTVISDTRTIASDVSSVPASFLYDSIALRKELKSLGEDVGPITSTTKKVYLRRLYRLKKRNSGPSSVSCVTTFTPELQRVLNSEEWESDIMNYAKYEMLMSAPFENPDPNRRWREGVAKSSFNYLLLDPRISQNLPATVTSQNLSTWRQFISSVFYIGKGKRSRPYAHLYQAVHSWNRREIVRSQNAKIQRILDIWKDGHGVVCLHVFQNVIPVEAFTREAAMIDAIGSNNIVNLKSGEYYGPASTWRTRQKRQLGVHLLYRAMRIFLCDGERQLRPGDID
ncbi:uncharacterized protein LOC117643117 [Thrips palmi]|uniref:Uncharacterized protein LOC117643117 n=1 Tax=Thrips palmi TaxID=161013 RepID=A0A6P8YKW9_THRPL|nr:uncharacterized protein LOC117643117 [Thrips palmi]